MHHAWAGAFVTAAQPALTAELLCAGYARQVYRFAAMVARSDADAEDLAQEALLRAIRNLHRFDPERGAIASWLWSIVLNAARDAGRGAGRRQALWERLAALRVPEESIENRALERLRDADLLAAVRALPARARTLLALRFGAGMDYAAVGAAVGLTPGAATAATRRALNILRHRLEGMDR